MSNSEFITDTDVPHGSLVLFDFDGTLSSRDSLLPFLHYALGTIGLVRTLLKASPWLVGYALRLIPNDVAKTRLLSAAFLGENISVLREKGQTFAKTILPGMLQPYMMARLAGYQNAGCCCVLVSASLDLYLQPWAKSVGMTAVLCSSLRYDLAGRIAGGFKDKNCHGEEKVRRIQAFLKEQGSGRPPVILAYGDTRGDIPMMKLANQAWWVRSPSVYTFIK